MPAACRENAMPESLLCGALGGEEQKQEVEGPEALAGVDAFAAAVAAIASRQDPGVARKTEEFLRDQSKLLKVQKKHLEEAHALRLAHLRHQSHLLRGQRVGQAIRIAFQVVTALIAIVIGVGIAVLLHDAFTSRNVVIEPFDAPPSLAAGGFTGKVVANGLLDELTGVRSGTHVTDFVSNRALQNAWSGEVQFAVPEAGISIGELGSKPNRRAATRRKLPGVTHYLRNWTEIIESPKTRHINQRISIMDTARRGFLQSAASVVAGMAMAGPVEALAATRTTFPKGFRWGVSTAAHQIEGNNTNSDFWFFENIPGSPSGVQAGAACDSYN